MNRFLWCCMVSLAMSTSCLHLKASKQEASNYRFEKTSDEYDEFDLWVDEAVEGGILKKNIEFEKPSRIKRIIMWIAVPFVRLYTICVLRYRSFRAKLGQCRGSLFRRADK